MDIKALAATHKRRIQELAQSLGQLKGWNTKSAQGALRCAPMVVKEVELIGQAKNLTGAEKNSLAVEFILSFLPLPWWLSESFARPLLEAVVNMTVDALKDRFS